MRERHGSTVVQCSCYMGDARVRQDYRMIASPVTVDGRQRVRGVGWTRQGRSCYTTSGEELRGTWCGVT